MTLTDISRLLKIAKVPRSKTVQAFHPNPAIIVHVPATHYAIVGEVVKQMAMTTDNVRVTVLESRDVRPNEHVYVRLKGETHKHTNYPDGASGQEKARMRRQSLRARNANVVIDCAAVIVP